LESDWQKDQLPTEKNVINKKSVLEWKGRVKHESDSHITLAKIRSPPKASSLGYHHSGRFVPSSQIQDGHFTELLQLIAIFSMENEKEKSNETEVIKQIDTHLLQKFSQKMEMREQVNRVL
jgi:hypothetical protein